MITSHHHTDSHHDPGSHHRPDTDGHPGTGAPLAGAPRPGIPLAGTARRAARAERPRERGAVMVLMSLSLVAVVIMAALVVDGSQAYPQRRSMQNAADSAAIAGTRALDQVKYRGMTWSTVPTAVAAVVNDNGAESHVCTVLTTTGATIGSCSVQSAVHDVRAAGIRVKALDTRVTAFGNLAGRPTVTASATASASIQTLVGARVPFVICGNAAQGGYPILNADNTINVTAARNMGTIDIQSSQVPTCGAGSAFKGKVGEEEEVVVPSWVEADNGNGYEQEIEVTVANAVACPTGGPFTGCDMLVPIADAGTGNGNAIYLRAVAWAVFHISGDGSGNPKYEGYFRSDVAIVSGGSTSTALPGNSSTPRAIRLID
jgi:Flp pilus assembly protein TadG